MRLCSVVVAFSLVAPEPSETTIVSVEVREDVGAWDAKLSPLTDAAALATQPDEETPFRVVTIVPAIPGARALPASSVFDGPDAIGAELRTPDEEMFVLDLDGDGRPDYVEAVVCVKEGCDYKRYVDLARDGDVWVVVADRGND